MEHSLIGKILQQYIESTAYVFNKRIQRDPPGGIHITGNRKYRKRFLHIVRIYSQISCHHRNIPVGIPFFPDQPADLEADLPHLFPRCGRFHQMDGILPVCIRAIPVTEQFPLQMGHTGIVSKTRQGLTAQPYIRLFPHPGLFGQTHQRADHLFAESEELLFSIIRVGILFTVHDHRHLHIPAEQKKSADYLVLYRCKSGKPVKHNNAVPDHIGMFQRVRQQAELPFRRHKARCGIQKSLIQNAQILEFIIQASPRPGILGQFRKLFQINSILHKLGNGRFHFMNVTDAFDMGTNDFEPVFTVRSNLTQNQTFSGIIQHRFSAPSSFLKNPMGQTPKTEHVYIHNAAARMPHNQLFLCLHGKLVRNNDKKPGVRLFH